MCGGGCKEAGESLALLVCRRLLSALHTLLRASTALSAFSAPLLALALGRVVTILQRSSLLLLVLPLLPLPALAALALLVQLKEADSPGEGIHVDAHLSQWTVRRAEQRNNGWRRDRGAMIPCQNDGRRRGVVL